MKSPYPKQLAVILIVSFYAAFILTGCTKTNVKPGANTTTTNNTQDNSTTIKPINPTANCIVSTFAGSGLPINGNGLGTTASFNVPVCLAADSAGNIYVADADNNMIRKIDPTGLVTTFAGTGVQGKANGLAANASFNLPFGVALDRKGNLYVADLQNGLIREINKAGVVSTVAGNGLFSSINGSGSKASFAEPDCVATDRAGNIYVGEISEVRKIAPGGIVTTLAGSTTNGWANGTGSAASFNIIQGIAVDSVGNVYVADSGNNLIRKITPTGVVSTVAGIRTGGSADGDSGVASFNTPSGIALDKAGNLYVTDSGNNLIRKISTAGVVSTIAGTGAEGSANGTGNQASFNSPLGITVDLAGNIYVSDANNIIRKIVVKQ